MPRVSYTDRDLGMNDILKAIKSLSHYAVKVGIPEKTGKQKGKKRVAAADGTTAIVDSDVTVAEYATWNEEGTKDGRIPARSFVKGWADARRKQIPIVQARLIAQMIDGKLTPEKAIRRLGEYGSKGIQSYMRTGNFKENAKSTVAKKGSSIPLMDIGTMKGAVTFEVVET
jgi:hypothetical protein